ncbi:hypothetical protein [Micromonospora haikouensis]|uniref:hypothetical protein n=1 Tax=Micromonospora haikouensis TaxID=686309 RepID=UPI00114CF15E|nr:hypothetical protein [Micromonospora haikouensis]
MITDDYPELIKVSLGAAIAGVSDSSQATYVALADTAESSNRRGGRLVDPVSIVADQVYSPAMHRRRPNRTLLRAFSTFGLVFATVCVALAAWSIADEHRGSGAVAEVLDVEQRGAKTFLTVQFSTNHGEVCQSRLRVATSANRAVSAGQRIRVHHAKSDPCLRVREDGDQSGWLIILVAVALLIVFGIMTYVAWRRPRPPLPLRYSGMP